MKKQREVKVGIAGPRLETRRLKALKPHPDQSKYFGTYGEHQYKLLKADIKANGVRQPIEVLPAGNAAGYPAGTILAGKTRRAILVELGKSEAEVCVRYDLVGATKAEVDTFFLTDNAARRNQSPLDVARVAVGLYRCRLERNGDTTTGADHELLNREDLRAKVAKVVGMSGRNLQRYLNVLAAPEEVQDALNDGRIKLVDAARVSSLPKQQQSRLAARLGSEEDPRTVFAEVFGKRPPGRAAKRDALARFARSLEAAHAELGGRGGGLTAESLRACKPSLLLGQRLLQSLLKKS